MEKVNLNEAFAKFTETWRPKIVGEINESYVKLARLKGEFIWHQHEAEDEFFFIVKGHLLIRLKDGEIHLQPGEFVIIPRGVEHLPVAEEEVWVMLLEPKTTINTGAIHNERTVESEWLDNP